MQVCRRHFLSEYIILFLAQCAGVGLKTFLCCSFLFLLSHWLLCQKKKNYLEDPIFVFFFSFVDHEESRRVSQTRSVERAIEVRTKYWEIHHTG